MEKASEPPKEDAVELNNEPQTLFDLLCILDEKASAFAAIQSQDEFRPAAAQGSNS